MSTGGGDTVLILCFFWLCSECEIMMKRYYMGANPYSSISHINSAFIKIHEKSEQVKEEEETWKRWKNYLPRCSGCLERILPRHQRYTLQQKETDSAI